MFTSNQVFDICCDAKTLPKVIAMGMQLHGDEMFTREDGRVKLAFAEPVKGVYCIGPGSMQPYESGPNKGWAGKLPSGFVDYQFDYDAGIAASVIAQWAMKQDMRWPSIDGSVEKGIRAMSLDTAVKNGTLPYYSQIGVTDVSRTILVFTAYPLENHK